MIYVYIGIGILVVVLILSVFFGDGFTLEDSYMEDDID
jgi:hypothetical protein